MSNGDTNFGISSDIQGDTLVVGSRSGGTIGSVFVYQLISSEWKLQQKLSSRFAFDYGAAVNLDGNSLMIGASRNNLVHEYQKVGRNWQYSAEISSNNSEVLRFGNLVQKDGNLALVRANGGIYLFEKSDTEWYEMPTLEINELIGGSSIVESARLENNTVYLGGIFRSANGAHSRAVLAFMLDKKNQWAFLHRILPEEDSLVFKFGKSLVAFNNHILIGEPVEPGTSKLSSVYSFSMDESLTWELQDKIVLPEGPAQDYFGSVVKISGEWAFVSAVGDDDDGQNSGSVYVYKKQFGHWGEHSKLTAENNVEGGGFGYSIAINADTLVIGAPYQIREESFVQTSGRVFIYKLEDDAWNQTSILEAPESDGGRFGFSIAIHNNEILIGSPISVGGSTDSVYSFSKHDDIWELNSELEIQGFGINPGLSISMSDKWAVVGANSGNSQAGSSIGYVHIYEYTDYNEWVLSQTINSPMDRFDTGFGNSVSLFGNRFVVGAPYYFDLGEVSNQKGRVYTYINQGGKWKLESEFFDTDFFNNPSSLYNYFGDTVQLQGNKLAVSGGNVAVYHLHNNQWNRAYDLIDTDDGISLGRFERNFIHFDERDIIVGYPQHDILAVSQGAARIYRVSD